MNNRESKLGRPSLREDGADIELGQAVFEEDKGTVDRTFEAELPVVQDALWEVLKGVSKDTPDKIVGIIDPDAIVEKIAKDLKEKDAISPLAILEAGQYSVMEQRRALEEKKAEGEDDEGLDERIDTTRALEARYREASDFLFSHSETFDALPERKDIMDWVANEKRTIETGAKEEEKEWMKKVFNSKLKAEVPAFARFLEGKQIIRDYDTLLSAVEDRLNVYREAIRDDIIEDIENPRTVNKDDIKNKLRIIYTLRSFLSLLEGERNEKIALQK